MVRHVVFGLSVSLALSFVVGCTSKDAAPAIEYSPAITLTDIVAPLDFSHNAYHLLDPSPTVGRFTCGLAVAKLAAVSDGDHVRLFLAEMKTTDQSAWTEAFRGVSGIRDIAYLSPVAIRAVEETRETPILAARKLEAQLLLEYAPTRVGPNTAEIWGVLYDVTTRRPIATIHQRNTVIAVTGVELPPDGALKAARKADRSLPNDVRPFDAEYKAMRAFERSTLACMREVIKLDAPATSTEESRWRTESGQQ